MKTFVNTAAVITGGSSGIGLALAHLLFRSGAHVWILARQPERLSTALESIEAFRINPEQKSGCIQADITDREELNQALGKHVETYGAPDLLVNSAGVAHPGVFEDLDPSIFDWMMDVNYHGTVNVCKALVPAMIRRQSGHIVNISSVAGYLGTYGYTAYGASKYAVRGFTETLRAELRLKNIRVSLVYPPDTDTPQLHYEDQYKPALTRELAKTTSKMSAADVAVSILNGIRKNRFVITPGLENTILYKLSNLLGAGSNVVIDMVTDSALRSMHKQNQELPPV